MRTFNAADRCDRCGGQAYNAATKPGHHELLFCNHHYREHREKLHDEYWLIETEDLVAT